MPLLMVVAALAGMGFVLTLALAVLAAVLLKR